MDFLLDNEMLSTWLIQHGSIVLFFLLVSGIIILPVPEETMMVLAGILMSQGKLNIPFTIIAALAGSMTGITLSYLFGRTAGHYVLEKYGRWLGITKHHINKVNHWFDRFGKWTLSIGYFIPGVRHFTGFVSGMTRMRYHQFALYAYSGALVWVTTFLSLGYFSGNYIITFIEELDIDEKVAILIIIVTIVYLLYLKFGSKSVNQKNIL